MAMLDRAKDRLASLEAHGWRSDPAHPDLVAAKEAEILRQGFSESLRAFREDAQADDPLHPDPTGTLLAGLVEAERLAKWLEESAYPDEFTERYRAVAATCKPCHEAHRD
jgi:hypothetical protein